MRSIHPQEVQGDPSAVRWVVHTGTDDVISLALLEVEGIWT